MSSITDPKSFDDGYKIFKFAQALVDHPAAVKLATSNVLTEFAEDNVVYLELRSTPRNCAGKMTKKEYVESIVQSIKGQSAIKATLLVSIDRRKSIEEANENVNLAIELRNKYPDVIVGVDLSGDARVNNLKEYYPSLIKAKENGLKVALHFAEENNPSEIEFVLNSCSTGTFKPDRVGHCTHVIPDFLSSFADLKIPSEICLSSNGQAHHMFSQFLNVRKISFVFYARYKFSIEIKIANITCYHNRKRHFAAF